MKKFDIFYQVHNDDFSFFNRSDLTVKNLKNSHVFVMRITAKDLEDCYVKMQGENYSPNGEARDLIESLGLWHTSMSVNDVVYDVAKGKYFQVISTGFIEVK